MKPYFTNVSDFVQMGGHGAFVWACYGITFVAIAVLIWHAISERKSTIVRLQRQANTAKKNDRLTNKQRKELGAGAPR